MINQSQDLITIAPVVWTQQAGLH